MKNTLYILILVMCFFTSCTDVIDVDVPTADPRLVIEASLDWEKGTSGMDQTIKLSTTTPYFEPDTPAAVVGAQVSVIRASDNAVFNFEDQLNGDYKTSDFGPVLNETYTLNITYKGETFTATTRLLPTTSIDEVNQSRDQGFNDEALEVNVYFKDPADEVNFYLLTYKEIGNYTRLVTLSDEFLNGNEIYMFYERRGDDDEDEFQPGDTVDINLYNISEEYHNFVQLLENQSGEGTGNPFAAVPVELRGNCINETDPDNYPYGYFRVTQTDKKSYTFVEEED